MSKPTQILTEMALSFLFSVGPWMGRRMMLVRRQVVRWKSYLVLERMTKLQPIFGDLVELSFEAKLNNAFNGKELKQPYQQMKKLQEEASKQSQKVKCTLEDGGNVERGSKKLKYIQSQYFD
ncbi:hypothetical protein M422DRAFT_266688 [Sphaerobolus stellatus SS14]|uniref:Uncharacterized protein n=1 Tax=Sphaerobolus stellatus (strain SS14) TaxID=990650 RepID=A0A0C9V282_SPHS4|nr:hypothetical protein M422DRAFT_266688 [Sphaerobolus stellatus SS14]